MDLNNILGVVLAGGKSQRFGQDKSQIKLQDRLLIDYILSEIVSEFNEILAYGDNKVIEVGTPTVLGAKVEANLIKNSKNRTILIFKKRRRQNSRRKNGHRQEYSMIRINKIFSKDGKVLSEAEKIAKPSKKEVLKKEASK